MKRAFIVAGFLLTSSIAHGALSKFWVGDGAYKLPRQDFYPYVNCATCTITRTWDGTTAKLYGAKNETVGFVLYMGNATGADIPEVSVKISSFSGPNGAAIVAPEVSSMNVTQMRPIEEFYVRYLQIKGMTQLSWDGSEYEQRDLPERFRRPCTTNVNNDCAPNGGTLWTDRPDHDKFIPEILVPYEHVAISSFTVAKSSSQAVWFDVYVGTSLPAGNYTARIDVRESLTVSTSIPVALTVYNFTLPASPSLKAITYMSSYNLNYRHQGTHFPSVGGAAQTTRDHYAQFMKRHRFAAVIGDDLVNNCAQSGKDYPCPEYVSRLNGSLYTPTSGYINGPGIGVGDEVYSIGTYSSWPSATWSNTLTGGANGFCVNVTSWSAFFNTNFPNTKVFLYLQDEPSDLTLVNKWSTWMSTECVQTKHLNSMFTGNIVSAQSSAPHLDMPVSTSFLGASSATWQTAEDAYQTTGTTQAWAYNSHPSHTGSTFATEDDGMAPVTIFWAMFKKHIQGWFFWESAYWTDTNSGDGDNDPFNDAMTFGFRSSNDSVKGSTGFQYSNGDGVLVYPGKDVIGTVNYGFDGPIASWRLKMLRRGLQDGDYMTLAAQANPAFTTAIVLSMVPEVLWEHGCFTLADCTYAYGGRSWTNDPNTWAVARAGLAALADSGRQPFFGNCKVSGSATVH
jgi:hypothetical protein